MSEAMSLALNLIFVSHIDINVWATQRRHEDSRSNAFLNSKLAIGLSWRLGTVFAPLHPRYDRRNSRPLFIGRCVWLRVAGD